MSRNLVSFISNNREETLRHPTTTRLLQQQRPTVDDALDDEGFVVEILRAGIIVVDGELERSRAEEGN